MLDPASVQKDLPLLLVFTLTCEIVAYERNAHVDEIVVPAWNHGFGGRADDPDKLALEELIAVEENVIGIPSTSSC